MSQNDEQKEFGWMSFSYKFRLGLVIYCGYLLYMAAHAGGAKYWDMLKPWELLGKVFLAEFGVETIYRLYHWLKKA